MILFYTIDVKNILFMSRYDELMEVLEDRPSLIVHEWPGIPTPIDAAVFYDGDSFL